MKIVSVRFSSHKIHVNPEIIFLERGENLIWNLSSNQKEVEISLGYLIELQEISRFAWEVYFENDSPFNYGESKLFKLETQIGEAGEIKTGQATKSGEFKYGIRLKNADNGEELEDEDPIIVVR